MDLDAQRKAAGERAAAFVQDGMVIGFGTGRGATAALEALAARKARVRGVPTSQKTVELCRRLGLAIVSFDDHPQLDLVIDGADEVDPQAQLLKGGGGAHLRGTDRALKGIAGVVDHGLFLDFAPTVVVGGPSGVRVISG